MAQKEEVQFSRETQWKEVAIKPDFITERLSLILKICWLFGMVTANDLWNEKFFPNPVSFSISVLHDVLFASCLNSATLKIFSNINVHFNSLLWSLFLISGFHYLSSSIHNLWCHQLRSWFLSRVHLKAFVVLSSPQPSLLCVPISLTIKFHPLP